MSTPPKPVKPEQTDELHIVEFKHRGWKYPKYNVVWHNLIISCHDTENGAKVKLEALAAINKLYISREAVLEAIGEDEGREVGVELNKAVNYRNAFRKELRDKFKLGDE